MGMSASQARLLSITARLNDVEFKSQEIANIKIRLADESEQLAMKYTKAISQQKYTYTTYASGQAQKIDLTLNSLMQSNSRYTLKTLSGAPVMTKQFGDAYYKATQGYNAECMKDKTSEQKFRNSQAIFCLRAFGCKQWWGGTEGINGWQDLYDTFGEENVKYYENMYAEMFEQSGITADDEKLFMDYVSIDDNCINDPAWLYNAIESGEYMLYDKTTGEEVTASNTVALAIETDNSNFAKAEAEYNAANMKINNKEKLLDNELKKLDTEHNALSTEMDSIKNLIGKNIEKSFNLFS